MLDIIKNLLSIFGKELKEKKVVIFVVFVCSLIALKMSSYSDQTNQAVEIYGNGIIVYLSIVLKLLLTLAMGMFIFLFLALIVICLVGYLNKKFPDKAKSIVKLGYFILFIELGSLILFLYTNTLFSDFADRIIALI